MKLPKPQKLFNEEAEMNIIGSMLMNPAGIPDIVNIVDAADFFLSHNQLLFSQIRELYHTSTADVVLLKDKLKNDEVFDEIGGYEYLQKIYDYTISPANGVYYAKQVKDYANRRKLLAACGQITNILEDKTGTAEKIQRIQTLAANIKTTKSADKTSISESVRSRFESVISGRVETIEFPFRSTSYLTQALMPGTVTIIAGSAGASKSLLLLQCLTAWHHQGVKSICYELEEDREFHLTRALAQRVCQAELTNMQWCKVHADSVWKEYGLHQSWLDEFGNCIEAAPDSQLTYQQAANWVSTKAKQKYRIIAIDPMTAILQTKENWICENTFLQNIKRIAVDDKCSVILVTHPVKTLSKPDMTQLAGSAAISRFAQTILWLESHQPQTGRVLTFCGTAELEYNRTLHILKSRNGAGQGKSIAFNFDMLSLNFRETGILLKN